MGLPMDHWRQRRSALHPNEAQIHEPQGTSPGISSPAPCEGTQVLCTRGFPRELDFFFRTVLKDRPKGPPTANHQPPTATNCQPPTASGDQPPTANCHQPPITLTGKLPLAAVGTALPIPVRVSTDLAGRFGQPGAVDEVNCVPTAKVRLAFDPPPTATNRQLPTTSANRHQPPTAKSPPTMVEHMSYTRSFYKTAVQEHFFFPLRTPLL